MIRLSFIWVRNWELKEKAVLKSSTDTYFFLLFKQLGTTILPLLVYLFWDLYFFQLLMFLYFLLIWYCIERILPAALHCPSSVFLIRTGLSNHICLVSFSNQFVLSEFLISFLNFRMRLWLTLISSSTLNSWLKSFVHRLK